MLAVPTRRSRNDVHGLGYGPRLFNQARKLPELLMNLITRSCGLAVSALLFAACGAPAADSAVDDKVRAAQEMAASVQAYSSPEPKTSSAPTSEAAEPSSAGVQNEPVDESEAPTSEDSNPEPIEHATIWQQYPWGSNGLECPHPSASPGVRQDVLDPRTVVVIGDSLIRDSRSEIAAALESRGFSPVFVCWGGKNLEWGSQQVSQLRELQLMPRCLVFNLGTNDLKGTTAQGLADAVSLETVGQRLTSLLQSVSDVDDVFVVDISADLSLAPSTMARVDEAPGVYRQAAMSTGVGDVIDWSEQVQGDPGLIGSDGIHDTPTGRLVRAQLIATAVARDCG